SCAGVVFNLVLTAKLNPVDYFLALGPCRTTAAPVFIACGAFAATTQLAPTAVRRRCAGLREGTALEPDRSKDHASQPNTKLPERLPQRNAFRQRFREFVKLLVHWFVLSERVVSGRPHDVGRWREREPTGPACL